MKFTIVTPVLNGEKYIEETILSVLTQKGDFDIEYIVVDGKSEDRTYSIMKKYDRLLKAGGFPIQCRSLHFYVLQKKDRHMYDAINLGFSRATGDVYAYINSDDVYLPGAFQAISEAFRFDKNIAWLKGITSYMNEYSSITKWGTCYLYDRAWIRKGVYGRYSYFIEQDSVFWKKALWKKTGGFDPKYPLAGDFYLWIQFSKFVPLYSLDTYVSCFRKTRGQLSEDKKQYLEECDDICKSQKLLKKKFVFFKKLQQSFPSGLTYAIFALLFGKQRYYKLTKENNTLRLNITRYLRY